MVLRKVLESKIEEWRCGKVEGEKGKQKLPCSTSLAIEEVQMKTTLWFHIAPVRMVTIKSNWQLGWGKGGPSFIVGGLQTGATTLEICMEKPTKAKSVSTPQPHYSNPRHMPKGLKADSTDACSDVFITAPSTMLRKREQPKCPSADKWWQNSSIYTHFSFIIFSCKKKWKS